MGQFGRLGRSPNSLCALLVLILNVYWFHNKGHNLSIYKSNEITQVYKCDILLRTVFVRNRSGWQPTHQLHSLWISGNSCLPAHSQDARNVRIFAIIEMRYMFFFYFLSRIDLSALIVAFGKEGIIHFIYIHNHKFIGESNLSSQIK